MAGFVKCAGQSTPARSAHPSRSQQKSGKKPRKLPSMYINENPQNVVIFKIFFHI